MPAPRLNDDIHRKIVEGMRLGSYLTIAAHLAGIAESTLTKWMRRGREDLAAGRSRTAHARLVADIERAEAGAEVRALGVIQAASRAGDWRAASWWLSHRHPDRWTDRTNLTAQIEVGSDEFAAAVADLVAAVDEQDNPDRD